MDILGMIPGAVTPLVEHKVVFFMDRSFFDGTGLVGVHLNDNTSTV